MCWLGIANFHRLISHFAVVVAAASLLLASVVHAGEMQDFSQNMPRGYAGEFRWEGDPTVQNLVIVLDAVNSLNGGHAEALGCGTYEVGRQVTRIKVRMLVRLSDLQVEIFELEPQGGGSFETNGSHRGKLSKDLQQIDAQWVTTDSGRRGELHLRALPTVTCAPAGSA
jgi:hypothetical protein